MESTKINHEGFFTLEQALIKVPFEQMRKDFKTQQRIVEKELANVASTMDSLLSPSASPTPPSLEALIDRLKELKRKVSVDNTTPIVKRTRARLEHLQQLSHISSTTSASYERWSQLRLNRVMVDFMLRQGHHKTATLLAKETGVEQLVDYDMFAQSLRIETSLRSGSCTECLQWCNENRSNLKKIKSTLEFNLRLAEYVNLLKRREISSAISYAKKYLVPWSESHLKEIQKAMALIAFPPDTELPEYKKYYDERIVMDLVRQFRKDEFTILSQSQASPLYMSLQAGLSVLKTQACYSLSNMNINCPVCSRETFNLLAAPLPRGHHLTSSLVCRATGEIMNENNPPVVLPNGYVYSAKFFEHQDPVTCVVTGQEFRKSAIKKVFIS